MKERKIILQIYRLLIHIEYNKRFTKYAIKELIITLNALIYKFISSSLDFFFNINNERNNLIINDINKIKNVINEIIDIK